MALRASPQTPCQLLQLTPSLAPGSSAQPWHGGWCHPVHCDRPKQSHHSCFLPWAILVILSYNCLNWSKAERKRQHQQELSCFPKKWHHEKSCAEGLKRQLEGRSPHSGFGWSKWPLGLHIIDLTQSRWYKQAFIDFCVCGVLRCAWHALVSGQGVKNFASGFNGNQESSKKQVPLKNPTFSLLFSANREKMYFPCQLEFCKRWEMIPRSDLGL